MAGRQNYITNMIKQFGDNWIVALKPDDIQRSAKRIFKEMVKGNFDYEQVGKYFLDGKFLDNLIIAANNELEVNTLYLNAVMFYEQYYPSYPNIKTQEVHLNTLCHIYSTIGNRLQMVKQCGNIGPLVDISAFLFSYRTHLN